MRIFLVLLMISGCQSLAKRPLPPEADVAWISLEPDESRKFIAMNVRLLHEVYQQKILPDNVTMRWSEDCLKQTHIPEIDFSEENLIHVSEMYTRDGHPGFCDYNEKATKSFFAYIHCEGDAHVLKISCPVNVCKNYNWKKLCI